MKKEKVYKLLLLLLIISIVGGSYLYTFTTPVGTIYSYRIVLFLLTLFMLVNKDFNFPRKGVPLLFSVFLLVLLVYGGLLSYKSLDLYASIKALFNIGSGLVLWLVIWSLHCRFDWFWRVFINNWVFTLILILLISYWEILTGNHLTGNFLFKLNQFPSYHVIQNVPVATFDNPNYLSLFLTLSVAFLLYFKKLVSEKIAIILIVSSLVVLCLTDSKLSTISLFVIGVFFLIYNRIIIQEWFKKEKKRLFIGGVVSVIFFFGISEHYTNNNRVTELSYIGKIKSGSSYQIRKNLILNGLDFLESSNFLGIGPGQYPIHTSRRLIKYDVDTVLSPHSLIIELLSEYGIMMFIFFVVIFIFLFIKAILFFKLENKKYILFLTLLVVYPILSNNNSSFLSYPLNWFILSIIILLHQDLNTFKNEKNSCTNNS